MTTIMASAVSIYIYSCPSSSSSSISRPSSLCSLSTCVKSNPSTQISCFPKWNSQLGFSPYSSWTGLRHLGSSIPQRPSRNERKRHCKSKGVHASLFGVGAPEALVIGVVALLVFGPKGLAEVARNLGKTLRAFQPTIRELQDVSREFKSTLEREIGLDEIQNSKQNTYSPNITRTPTTTPSVSRPEDANIGVDPNSAPSPNRAYSSEDYLKITEEQLKASAAKQQAQNPSLGENQLGKQTQPQDAEAGAAAAAVPQQQKQGESET